MVGTYGDQIGILAVLAGLLCCRVSSQNGCTLLKNEFIIDVSLAEAPEGVSNNYEKKFLGFRGAKGSIQLDVEQDGAAIDFKSNFRIFMGIADFNFGYCIQRIGNVDRDGNTAKYSDDNNILEYTIVCTELSTQNKYYYPLIIRITDVNDNYPVFKKEPYEITVDKGTAKGFTLMRVVATDKDYDKNRHIVYGIGKGSGALNDASQYFHFPIISSGALSLKKKIDVDAFKRDGIKSMTLNIFAMDMGRKSLRTDSSVKVNIDFGDEEVITKEESVPVLKEKGPGNCVLVDLPSFQNGSINVKLPEVISKADLSVHPYKYRTYIGIENTVTQINLKPLDEKVKIEYVIPQSGHRGYYIRLLQVIDRDGETNKKNDDTNFLMFDLECKSNNQMTVFPLKVHITDVNDNTPILYNNKLEFTVPSGDDRPLPVDVYDIKSESVISDKDAGVNRKLTFGIIPTDGDVLDASTYFAVNVNTGIISQIQNIDYNDILESGASNLFINISITDSPRNIHRQRTSYWTIMVNIEYITSTTTTTTFKPVVCNIDTTEFDSEDGGNYHLSIPEAKNYKFLKDNSELFTRYIGFDPDAQISLVQDDGDFDPNRYFKILVQGSRQYITLVKLIDRDGTTDSVEDDTNSVSFSIQCIQNGPVVNYPIVVNIEDVNDNAPVFQNTPYFLNVNEGTAAGQVVYGSVLATDVDSGSNKEILYHLVPVIGKDDYSKYFAIHQLTGEMLLRTKIDFEKLATKKFQLNISATNDVLQTLTTYTTIDVTVTDSDDQGPIFSYDTCHKVNDKCVNPTYSSSIKSGIVSGRLTVYPVPANEMSSSVNIKARDQDSLRHPIVYTLDESIPDGYSDYFTVDITGGSSDSGYYTAHINQVKVIKRADVQTLKLVLKAFELNKPDSWVRAEIDINVLQTNLYPPQLVSSTGDFIGYINENDRIGSYVFTSPESKDTKLQITVTDTDISPVDVKPTYKFSLSPNTVFNIDNDGTIRTVEKLDYEMESEYSLTVTVTETDTKEKFSTATALNIKVLDINDNVPVFTKKLIQLNMTEGDFTSSPKMLIKVSAIDKDTGDNGDIKYEILDVRPDDGNVFSINEDSGKVYAEGVLRPDTVYSLRIKAVDNGTPPRSSVSVLDIHSQQKPNTPPHFLFPQPASKIAVRENQQLFTRLLEISATDPDGDDLSYSITGGNVGQTFSIDESSGMLSAVKQLDYEVIKQYELEITATDNRGMSASTTTVIDVIDSNDNFPVFSASVYEVGLIEGDYSESPKKVLQMTAVDADSAENGKIDYSIIKIQPEDNGRISIHPNTGEIDVIGQVTGGTKYTMTVQASDGGSPPKTATTKVYLTIIPLSISNNAPVIPQSVYTASVSEGTAIGTVILTIPASDPDDNELTYRIDNQSPDTSTFQINNEGVIVNTKFLDRESVSEYTLQIEVSDSKGLSADTKVIVKVTDMNDNAPVFDRKDYTMWIVEGQTVDFKVKARDADEVDTGNSLVTYSFVDPVENFEISPDGNIKNLKPLDREDKKLYEIGVVAMDNGLPVLSSTVVVTVHVTDTADSVPIFNPSVYEVNVPEGHEDYLVVTVTATDADEVENIVYIFEEGDTDDFTLDSTSGQIRTKKALDILSKSFYSFTVTTTDGQEDSSALVSVTVVGENEEIAPPIIVSEPILPKEEKTTEVRVTAVGNDTAPVFSYPTCLRQCDVAEYSTSVQSAASQYTLRLFPMPSDNPTLPVPLKAHDQNTPNAELNFTVTRTVPANLERQFIIEKEGPDENGYYTASVKQIGPLYVDKTPKVQVVIRATEDTANKLYSEATIYVAVERHYILERAKLEGADRSTANKLSYVNLYLLLLMCVIYYCKV